jgi:hypothetical protein
MLARRQLLKALGAGAAADALPAPVKKPNFLLVLADDMGFSDAGCYGGEIDTPNLDRLAARGLRFTQAYSTARCGPSRSSLLTGLSGGIAILEWGFQPVARQPGVPIPLSCCCAEGSSSRRRPS